VELMTASPETELFPVERDRKLRFIIPGVVAMGFTLEGLDSTIITTAIPTMARSLQTTPLLMNLAVTTYVLVLAVFIPISGWLADRFGTRRIFASALITFSLGSILCGLSTNLPLLVGARAVQGLGGAMMTPVGRLILLRSFPRDQYVAAMTYMTLPAVIGPVLGPLLGGALTTYASWRWAFFINIPFGLVGALLALRFIPKDRGAPRAAFDLTGFLLFGLGVGALQYALEAIGKSVASQSIVLILLLASVALFAGFAVHARRTATPAVDFGLFRDGAFRTGSLAGGLCRIGMNATPFLLPLLLQLGFGATPIQSGLITFTGVFGAVSTRVLLPRLLRALGYDRTLAATSLCCALILAGFALIERQTPLWLLVPYVIIFGVVRALQFMGSNTLTYADLPPEKLSAATSLGGMMQQLSVSFGVSLGAALLGLITGPQHILTVGAFHTVFLILALLPIVTAPFFLWLDPATGVRVSRHIRAPSAAELRQNLRRGSDTAK
jgi:EmrB/QacA subfamily drug resistance transporter